VVPSVSVVVAQWTSLHQCADHRPDDPRLSILTNLDRM